MTTSLQRPTVYNVKYQVPRSVIGLPGRQNRASGGRLTVTPGFAHPMEVIWGDYDGVPIGLRAFTPLLLMWAPNRFSDGEFSSEGSSRVALRKEVEVVDVHLGLGFCMLTGRDTEEVGRAERELGGLRWGVVLVGEDGEKFLCVVSDSGGTSGEVFVARAGVPPAEAMR